MKCPDCGESCSCEDEKFEWPEVPQHDPDCRCFLCDHWRVVLDSLLYNPMTKALKRSLK
jgi:hypothetical protein